jgi:hypothetical protein
VSSPQVEELAGRIMQQTGVTMERARLIAAANLTPQGRDAVTSTPDVAPSILAEQDGRAEKCQQNDIRKLWITLGGKVWDTSAVTRSKITPGIPDLYLTLPRWAFAIWWESKSAEAVTRRDQGRSPAQMEFTEHVTQCGAPYGSGTFRDFVRVLFDHPDVLSMPSVIIAAIDKAGLTEQAGLPA